MKKTGSKNLKIIAATSMAIFSLFACFTATYAWFTAQRNINNGADDFEISDVQTSVQELSIHEFLGISSDGSKYYGFNPIPVGSADFSDDPHNPTVSGTLDITLDEFSLDDPNHPVLLLFKVSGGVENITAETAFPFIAINKPGAATLDSNHIVSSYAGLASKKSGASDGEIFEVTADENHGGKYDDDSYITTRYEYSSAKDEFELVWTDLAMYDNAFSSVAQFHSFLFTFDKPFNRNGNSYTVNSSSTAISSHTLNDTSTSGIWISSTDFSNDNRSSFVTFNAHDDASFNQYVDVFSGETDGYTYLGVVIDYYKEAVEYMSSYFLGHSYLNTGLDFECDWVTKI